MLGVLAPALACWALLGSIGPARAADTITLADISALRGSPPAANSEHVSLPYAGDAALTALSSFAQQIGAEAPKLASTETSDKSGAQSDDQAYAALKAFARSLGTAQPASIKDQPKLAAADSLMEWLTQHNKGSSEAPAAAPANGPVAGGKKSAPPVEAHYVGMKVCLGCHTSQAEAFGKTLMGRIGKTQQGKFDCENCHGPGSAHAKAGGGRGVGGIISFRPNDLSRTAEENNAICLNCHQKGDRTYWNGSTHETRGLMCTNCHTIMKAVSRQHQLKTAFEPDTCFQCHKDRRAQMYRSSHMPLGEGKMVCTDCHNPHGSATEALLKKDTINDVCYTCHAEKRGPFLWEHAPVRENCLNCHEPHGSNKEYLLKIQRPKLCAECHGFDHGTGLLNNQSQRFIFNKGCGNCHVKIHGSNHPAGAYFQR